MKFDILHKGQVVETRELGEGSYKIGRSSQCEIQLKSPQVSKQHALLVIKGNKAAILDLGSSNGVFVNGILVRKQRIEVGDEVVISDHRIRISTGGQVRAGRQASVDGNAARQIEFGAQSAEAPPEMSPQEKLLVLMDQRVLKHFYGVMKSVDWRMLLLSILGFSLLSAVLLSVRPIVRWGRTITIQESLARAHTILAQSVRENYRILAKTNDFARLSIEAAEAEKGILAAFVINPKDNTVLAPAKLLNKSVSDVYALIAVKKIIEEGEETVSIEKDSGLYIVAQPIYLFQQDQGERTLQGIVLAEFEIPTKVYSTFEPMVEAALFAILCALLAYFMIFKMFSYPIVRMQEQLDAALKGENVTVTCEAKFGELETLATVINFSVSRLRQGGGMSQPISGNDPEEEDRAYLDAVQGFDQSTGDALVLLDKDKRVKFVGKAMEELVSMRNQYAQGQNISDACKDQSFAGTAIDLSDRVVQSLGEAQFATLDINGISRNVSAVAQKNRGGEIRFVLITVKLGGG